VKIQYAWSASAGLLPIRAGLAHPPRPYGGQRLGWSAEVKEAELKEAWGVLAA